MTTLPLGLKRYILTSKELRNSETGGLVQKMITAKSKDQAWSKFTTQFFGPLKPDPNDWIIQEAII